MIGDPLLDGAFQVIVSEVDLAWTLTEVTAEGTAAGVTHEANILYGPAPAELTA